VKKRILSGMRPTGRLHLGNLLGALDNWVKLQDEYQCFYTIVDWHALTTAYQDTGSIEGYIHEMAIDWLSAGIDPDRSVVFIQSDVKEHAELHLLLSMITPLSWLERCPTYKDQQEQLKQTDLATYGFLGYPLLQAADIMAYRAHAVPVGEDQLPHLEICREIARRFNHIYGQELFPEPQARLNQVTIVPGIDGRKMSKSYDNYVSLSAGPEEIRRKVPQMLTDPQRARRRDPGNPEVCTVYAFHKAFNPGEVDEIAEGCRTAGIGCVECKQRLIEVLIEALAGINSRRRELEKDPDYIHDVLADGAKRAREFARETLAMVRDAMNMRQDGSP